MTFDTDLAERVRRLMLGVAGVTERRMFGGLAFLVHGHMSVTVTSHGGLMVRVDRAEAARLIDQGGVEEVIMRGRRMPGWLWLTGDALGDDEDLQVWVNRSLDLVQALPPKT